MEIQQIKYFLSLSKELHFGRAAKEAHITQPTLSQQIRKLEEELGVTLFERSPHRVQLTQAGTRFLPYAVASLDALKQGVSEVQEEMGEISGVVHLAAIPTIGPYILPKLITQIQKKAPNLQLEIYELTTSVLLEQLREGKIDLGILALPFPDHGIVYKSIGSEEFYLACAKENALAQKSKIDRKDLKNERMLILQEGHCFGAQSLDYCKKSRQDPQIIFQGSSLLSVMNLASSGMGVTLVPKMAIQNRVQPGLKFIPFKKPKPNREIVVTWRLSAPLAKRHQFLIQIIEGLL